MRKGLRTDSKPRLRSAVKTVPCVRWIPQSYSVQGVRSQLRELADIVDGDALPPAYETRIRPELGEGRIIINRIDVQERLRIEVQRPDHAKAAVIGAIERPQRYVRLFRDCVSSRAFVVEQRQMWHVGSIEKPG